MKLKEWKALAPCMILIVVLVVGGCAGSDGAAGPQGPAGATGSTGPSGPVIQSITADPPVVRPGESTVLTVSANDGAGNALSYLWSAAQGALSSAATITTNWTAPSSVGSYSVSVAVSNGTTTVNGYATVLVSVSPSGPIITNVSPAVAREGDEIRITGAGFGSIQGSATVTIGGVPAASIVNWSEWVVSATVPAGATSGSVIVSVGGTPSSPGYIVIPWQVNGVPISTAVSQQINARLIPDGDGGTIIVWEDYRNGADYAIYAQKVNALGEVQWTADGVAIVEAAETRYNPQLISDGAGGAIITWDDRRSGTNYDIYAQRVNAAGVVQWTLNGVAICNASADQTNPRLVSDGNGGAIITWYDTRSGVDYDVYAQRINAGGVAQWTVNGVVVTAATSNQLEANIVEDGSGGAIIAWRDQRAGNSDVYAQRINGAGVVQWTADGVAICSSGLIMTFDMVTDGAGGAVISWDDTRGGTSDIYAQRVDGAGVVQWTADGIVISSAADVQIYPRIATDGAGGAIIAWQDLRSGVNNHIYVQRVNAAGAVLWTANGAAVCTAANEQISPRIVGDGFGGAIITWQDYRNGSFGMTGWTEGDVYAQRVNASSVMQWTANGIAVSDRTGEDMLPALTADGSGGAVFSWSAWRNGADYDLYALGVTAAGK